MSACSRCGLRIRDYPHVYQEQIRMYLSPSGTKVCDATRGKFYHLGCIRDLIEDGTTFEDLTLPNNQPIVLHGWSRFYGLSRSFYQVSRNVVSLGTGAAVVWKSKDVLVGLLAGILTRTLLGSRCSKACYAKYSARAYTRYYDLHPVNRLGGKLRYKDVDDANSRDQ